MKHDLHRRLLWILHRGLVEARLLAQAKNHEQLFELTDTLEVIPSYMDDWKDEHLEFIRSNFLSYRTKYPNGSIDYLAHLDRDAVPPRF